jgi:hypothetical protein
MMHKIKLASQRNKPPAIAAGTNRKERLHKTKPPNQLNKTAEVPTKLH